MANRNPQKTLIGEKIDALLTIRNFPSLEFPPYLIAGDQSPEETESDFVDDYRQEIENGPDIGGNRIKKPGRDRGNQLYTIEGESKEAPWKQHLI